MPKRSDVKKVLIIGAGPIIIGQACEFDYSGTQACKALREEGCSVVLVNSNPATIMTDPEMADRTYIEPVTAEAIEKIIAAERPDALLPTVGGQTGLNTAMELAERGILDQWGVRLIGAQISAIRKAENRQEFKAAMERIGLDTPKSCVAHSMPEAWDALDKIGLPCVIRPGFTLGGTGGGIAFNRAEFETICSRGIYLSPINEVLIEESVLGWKEYELEVMRDRADNVVVVCSIENFDPMGVHTGDSITVAPAQTLTDKEYQRLRDAAFAVIREIGVETGGSNIQFALHPHNARLVAIEMNPRVSRSSALASKATGFPIAKIAAKLALGYTLDELPNDITRSTPAGFEPTLDYVVVKVPRFAFEKFPAADPKLTTQMKSVGEVMTIGRTFKEAFQKAWRGLETGHAGFGRRRGRPPETNEDRMRLTSELAVPTVGRVSAIYQALHDGFTVEEIHEITKIDRWFLQNLSELTTQEKELRKVASLETASCEQLLAAKRSGFSDAQLASFWNVKESVVRARRLSLGVRAGYKLVDTCAAEFEAATPYYYSAYESESETRVSDKKKIMIIGGGPNRIGQGIEFDYCCCHAAYALRELGFESIMINSNPETVSTDYDTSDLLFFEPLTVEDVLNIHDALKPDGAIVQFGGQTPLNLARRLREAGVNIVGTAVEEIERAGNRKLFNALIKRLKLVQPPGEAAMGPAEALQIAERIGYPVLVRPSFVLGGRAMEICHDPEQARNFLKEAFEVAEDAPVLVDKFIEDAIEVDVDAVSDGQEVIIAGMLEHIEEAGTHSGDAGMCLPPHSLSDAQCAKLADITRRLAGEMRVCGLINVQFAVKGGTAYILEVNPRASRTVPFIGKATGVPWAKIAAKCMVGVSLREQGVQASPPLRHLAVKESVFPFNKFPGNDILLGPEMKSTGEVMGIDVDFGRAFAKAQMAAGQTLPQSGNVFLSVCDKDKREGALLAERLQQLGYQILTTAGTHKTLARLGIHSTVVLKISEGKPNLLDYVENGQLAFAINTPSGRGHYTDEAKIRSTLVVRNIPCFTTMAAAHAVVTGISRIKNGYDVKALQDYYAVRG